MLGYFIGTTLLALGLATGIAHKPKAPPVEVAPTEESADITCMAWEKWDKVLNDHGFFLQEGGVSDTSPVMIYVDPDSGRWQLLVRLPGADASGPMCAMFDGTQWVHRNLVGTHGS